MYGIPKILDHHIVAINQSDSTIIARNHTIDLNACAYNFKKEHGTANGTCVGDRNITGKYFCFYTSGTNVMIHFKKLYVFNLFGNKLFSGTRTQRFHQLQNKLTKLGYTTYDLT
ncbi:MAG: hypothetical protein IJE00_00550 [Clostridia bacterium]|nr:hypothetical protein [Clostridia bacterium]